MSITDELRKEARGLGGYVYTGEQAEHLTAIADRIDAEHEAKVSYWQGASYKDGYDKGFASADDWLAQHEDAMAEHGWIRMPKDADGEYIRIGDKLIDEDDKPQKPAIVKCILYNDEGCVVSDIDPRGCWYDPSLLRHHHAPTVEDVLREMHAKLDEVTALYVGEAIDSDERDSDEARIFAEYADKLRLAEGEDA